MILPVSSIYNLWELLYFSNKCSLLNLYGEYRSFFKQCNETKKGMKWQTLNLKYHWRIDYSNWAQLFITFKSLKPYVSKTVAWQPMSSSLLVWNMTSYLIMGQNVTYHLCEQKVWKHYKIISWFASRENMLCLVGGQECWNSASEVERYRVVYYSSCF